MPSTSEYPDHSQPKTLDEVSQDIESLKADIESLKSEVDGLKASVMTFESQMTEIVSLAVGRAVSSAFRKGRLEFMRELRGEVTKQVQASVPDEEEIREIAASAVDHADNGDFVPTTRTRLRAVVSDLENERKAKELDSRAADRRKLRDQVSGGVAVALIVAFIMFLLGRFTAK